MGESHVLRSRRVRLETDELVRSTSALVHRAGPWLLFVTLTTRDPVGPEQLARKYRRLIRDVDVEDLRLEPGTLDWWEGRIRHVLAWEPQRRGAWHLHALWRSTRMLGPRGGLRPSRGALKARWEGLAGRRGGPVVEELDQGVRWLVSHAADARGIRFRPGLGGMARFELIVSGAAVSNYCAKYVSKGGLLDLFVDEPSYPAGT